MSRSRGKGGAWLAAVSAVVLVLLAFAALILGRFALIDDTAKVEALDGAILAWAGQNGLKQHAGREKREFHVERLRKWFSLERAFWCEPPMKPEMLLLELRGRAESLGIRCSVQAERRWEATATLGFPDGRPAARVTLWRMARIGLCMDDLGYQMAIARRALALPCAMTFAVLPLTRYASRIASLAASHGKEIYLHLPMESVLPLPEVPEYEIALRPGQDPVSVGAKIDRIMEMIPNAAGLNNHEGSLATEDYDLMAALALALARYDLVFMDSATTPATVGWKAARDSGLKWQLRDIFIDHTLDRRSIEGYFDSLVKLARSKGEALGVCHPHQVTLEVLERKIPQAIFDGIVFVPASALARRGRRPSRLDPK